MFWLTLLSVVFCISLQNEVFATEDSEILIKLDMILGRLDSIDERLENIENKEGEDGLIEEPSFIFV